ncbi:MAG: carboxypeptidase-like regulatory domain-containing protein [Bacteroidota bacterium]
MKFLCSIFLCLLTTPWALSQSLLMGKVIDPSTGEELINATIQCFQNDQFVLGAPTDFNGNFHLHISPGRYDILCQYLGYADKRITGVLVRPNVQTVLNIELSDSIIMENVVVICRNLPIINHDPPKAQSFQSGQDIRRSPTKSIRELAAMTPGVAFW